MSKETIKLEVKEGLVQFHTKLQGKVIIDIQTLPLKRSDRQNRFYWGAVIPTVENCLKEAGYPINSEDTHEFLKNTFNKKSIIGPNLNEITIGQSTSKLSKDDFSVYIKKIEDFILENFNTTLPQPFENYENESN